MAQAAIDPVTVKRQQRRTWDSVSAGWDASMELFEHGSAPVTDQLLRLGGVRSGQSVLDVGTGLGEPALTAARVVGATGRVLGIDIAPSMIEAARRRAGDADNIEYAVADLEDVDIDLPPGSFDVALSRWALMFAVDHVAALRTIARLLVPGGVLSAAVWGPPGSAPMVSLSYAVLSERLQLPAPPPGTPSPFSMADPDALAGELTEAGFVEAEITEFVVPFRLADVDEYLRFSMAVTPPSLLDLIGERYGSADDPDTWHAVRAAAEPYADGSGLSMPSRAWCVRATTPTAQASG